MEIRSRGIKILNLFDFKGFCDIIMVFAKPLEISVSVKEICEWP